MKLIDVHMYYGDFFYPIYKTGVNDLIDRMDLMGTEKTIIMSSLAINYDMVSGNAQIAEIVDRHPRLYGYIFVNSNYTDLALNEIKKYSSRKKFVGIKFHPECSNVPFNSPVNEELFNYIEKINMPINVHTWAFAEHGNMVPNSTPKIILEVARKRPKLKIMAGHMGGPAWKEMVDLAKGLKNIWVSHISSWADSDKVGYAIKELGSDKVLFGTGMMEGNGISQLGVIEDANITKEEKYKFCYKNAIDLFGLE